MRETAVFMVGGLRIGGFVVCTGVAVALVVTVWQAPSRGTTLIEVLRILISWPLVVGVLGLLGGGEFRRELRDLVARIKSIRAGSFQLDLDQAQDRPNKIEPGQEDTTSIRLTKEQIAIIRSKIDELFKLKEREKEAAMNLVTQLQTEIAFWQFEFLSVFLVPMTQNVLRWFAGLQNVQATKEFYHQTWRDIVKDGGQRDTMLSVLLSYGLLVQEGDALKITEKGMQFLGYVAWKISRRTA